MAIAGAGEEGELVRVRVEFSWYLWLARRRWGRWYFSLKMELFFERLRCGEAYKGGDARGIWTMILGFSRGRTNLS